MGYYYKWEINEVKKKFLKKKIAAPSIVPIIDDLENFRKYCLILKTVFDFPAFCAYNFAFKSSILVTCI